jgi:tetratricopeptide (TPR) repeat protein
MKRLRPTHLLEFSIGLGISSSETLREASAKRPERFGRWLLLMLIFLASSLPIAPSQTASATASTVHEHMQKAEAFLRANDQNSAAKEFDAVLALDPKNAEAYANLGVIAFSRHDYSHAAEHLSKALAIDQNLATTRALLGICKARLGDPSARQLLERSFNSKEKLKDPKLRLQVGLELARLYEQQGDSGATATVMQSLVDLDPDNVDVLFTAQRVYSELADDTLNKLAIVAPGSARMQQVIAERLVNKGDLKDAIDHYRKALQIDPRVPGVQFELGEAILESAPADESAQAESKTHFEAARTLEGDTAKIECEFASIALSQSQVEEAFARYRRAFQLNPNEVQAQMGLAKLLMMQEKPQEAVKYLRMAVQLDPLNGAAHYQLGTAYRRLQMTDMALKELHLSQEIKKAKDQVEKLYHEMNRGPQMVLEPGSITMRPPKANTDDVPDTDHPNEPQ